MTERLAERTRGAGTDAAERATIAARAERLVPSALREVPDRVAATGRTPFVLLVVALLGGGLVALLVLNVALAQDSHRLHDLQKRTSMLAEQKGDLQREVAMQSAPGELAKRAEELGMVPAGQPAYLDVSTGKVRGKPKPAKADKGDKADRGDTE